MDARERRIAGCQQTGARRLANPGARHRFRPGETRLADRLAAPLKDPPRVAAAVHAYLDGSPVEVTQASLAPGYIGFYLIEIQIPRIANPARPTELYLEAEGQQSNRVRLYVEQ